MRKKVRRSRPIGGIRFYTWSGKTFKVVTLFEVYMFALTCDPTTHGFFLTLWVKTTRAKTYGKVKTTLLRRKRKPTAYDVTDVLKTWQRQLKRSASMLGLSGYNKAFNILIEAVLLADL